MRTTSRFRFRAGVVTTLAAALTLTAAACGSSEPSSSSSSTLPRPDPTAPATTEAPSTTAAATTVVVPTTEAPSTTAAPATVPTTTAAPTTTLPSLPAMIQQPGECGLGNGQPASGEPIKIGALADYDAASGVDLTWGPQTAALYFDCVNANGGIYGRPIAYTIERDDFVGFTHIDSNDGITTLKAAAAKLVEQDKVLAVVGNAAWLECDVNGDYYAAHGYAPLVFGFSPSCQLTEQWSTVDVGPYYSTLGAAQAAVRAGATGKLVVVSHDPYAFWRQEDEEALVQRSVVDYSPFIEPAVEHVATAEGLAFELIDVPVGLIEDPVAVAQQVANAAGPGGGIVVNLDPLFAFQLLAGASQAGLADAAVWSAPEVLSDPVFAAALQDCCGDVWDGKLLINTGFDTLDSGAPDNRKMLELHAAAGVEFPVTPVSQSGYLSAKAATEALLRMGPDAVYTVETVNAAIRELVNVESDLLCAPWYYSSGTGINVSNNTTRTVTPQAGSMVEAEGCSDLPAVPGNPLAAIRAVESERQLR